MVEAFALEGDLDPAAIRSHRVRDGMAAAKRAARRRFPEAEEARWMTLGRSARDDASEPAAVLDALEEKLAARAGTGRR